MRARYVGWMVRLYWACIWIAGLALVTMTLIIPWGVFTRYVLGTGSSWPEPLATLLMIIFTFLGAAACYRANAHISVALFRDMLQPRPRAMLAILVDLLMAMCAVFMIVWGLELVRTTWHQTIGEFPSLSVGVSYLPLPIGSLVTLLFIIEHLWSGVAQDLVEMEADPLAGQAEVN